jgi:hypothetical protein
MQLDNGTSKQGLPINVVGLGLGAFLHPNDITMAAVVDQVKHVGLIRLGINSYAKFDVYDAL